VNLCSLCAFFIKYLSRSSLFKTSLSSSYTKPLYHLFLEIKVPGSWGLDLVVGQNLYVYLCKITIEKEDSVIHFTRVTIAHTIIRSAETPIMICISVSLFFTPSSILYIRTSHYHNINTITFAHHYNVYFT